MRTTLVYCIVCFGLLILQCCRGIAAPASNTPIDQDTLFNLALLNQKNDLDDEQYTIILSKWVDQGRVNALDVATILHLKEAATPITDTNLVKLEKILNTQLAAKNGVPNAHVDFISATNNFSFSMTNQPLVVTNLTGLLSNQKQLISNITILPGSPDSDAYHALTNNWDQILKSGQGYTTLQTNETSSPYFAFFSAGAQFLNPYVVSVPQATPHGFGTLTNAGSKTIGFVEFDWIYRHILRMDDNDTSQASVGSLFGGQIVNPFKLKPDLQYDLGFLLGSGGNLTNNSYSAQALAGSDFYTEFTCGLPFWRSDEVHLRQQVSLEISGGVTTESSFEIVHPNGFLGFGYEASFRPFIGSATTNNPGFFDARVGMARISTPSLTGTANQVRLDGNGVPIFEDTFAPECSAYLAYPLTSSLYMIVDANAFFGDTQPNSWNIKVGASIPMEKIAALLK